MKIGELAKLTDCPVETIRYYEREGLLPPPSRTASNYRHYGSEHVERLTFIRNCRSLDMTHEEIRRLLALREHPEAGCADANALVDEHIAHVRTRIASLQAMEQQLLELRQRCGDGSDASCGILQRLNEAGAVEDVAPAHSHVGNSHAH
ncbi:Cd(II)/Pb(II)-responsive transcriptional regulator [Pseudomonas sp. UL073]|uniref:Cd(II)/Pb(II)-responsive transcriptional regulator n=1 Tax=Zestomonas insulae TaxID=2809017 RepID=A0ABS2IG99_9GAMM|nr:Cd(II)/Pb(II)-responsive transcriptional regulator [Pseudomonas insulae]MBM7062094.1 Cd(II)/Pb(II)-responsive transcriptional regulator [Pseudomonas insulae]